MELPIIDLIAIGCSAGGIEALKKILPQLPSDFRPTVVVIQHIGYQLHNTLASFYSTLCAIPVCEAEDKMILKPGTIYFAPAGYHLMMEDEHSFALNVDPPVHYVRPAIDVFMESAAPIFRKRILGVILTGANQDGAEGLKLIQDYGGVTLVQDPLTADFPTMPKAALEVSVTSAAMNISDIAKYLSGLK